MFLAGIDQMVTDEKRILLAQLESINSMLLLRDKAMDEALKIKKWVAQTGSRLAGRIRQESWQDKINDLDRKTDWDVKGLQEAIDKSLRDVSRYEEYEVQAYLKEELAGLVNLSRADSYDDIGLELLHHLAKQYKLPVVDDSNAVALEEKLFALCLQEQLDILNEKIKHMNENETQELQVLLENEIKRLSPSDLEAIRQAIGLDELSAQSIMAFIKTGSSVAVAQLLISGTGFGAYLFLTTMTKAVSLLLGVTFSFGTYTALTSTLAFLLSPIFLLFIIFGSGGFLWWKTGSQLNDYLIKMVFLMGKAQLLRGN